MVKPIPGEVNKFAPIKPKFEGVVPVEKKKEEKKPEPKLEEKKDPILEEIELFKTSDYGYLLDNGLPVSDARQQKILADKIPFAVPYANKVTTTGGVRIKFSKPVGKIDDLVAMTKKGLIEIYLVSSHADKIIKGKPS